MMLIPSNGKGNSPIKSCRLYRSTCIPPPVLIFLVASEAEALKILSERHIDLIILMAGLDSTPLVISRHLKDLYPNICQLMLVNNNSDLAYFHTIEDRLYESIERLFVWNGSTKIFLVMAKYIEDKMNLDRDTHLGDIRVILLVENSIRYYSRYLPLTLSILRS